MDNSSEAVSFAADENNFVAGFERLLALAPMRKYDAVTFTVSRVRHRRIFWPACLLRSFTFGLPAGLFNEPGGDGLGDAAFAKGLLNGISGRLRRQRLFDLFDRAR